MLESLYRGTAPIHLADTRLKLEINMVQTITSSRRQLRTFARQQALGGVHTRSEIAKRTDT